MQKQPQPNFPSRFPRSYYYSQIFQTGNSVVHSFQKGTSASSILAFLFTNTHSHTHRLLTYAQIKHFVQNILQLADVVQLLAKYKVRKHGLLYRLIITNLESLDLGVLD